jgi:MFS family permease
VTYYLQESLGYTPIATGLAFLPMVGAVMVSATLATSRLLPRVGPKPLVPLGMALSVVGLIWLTRLGLSSGYVADVLPALLVTGLGIGLVMAPAMNVATYGVAAHDAGVASAGVNARQQIGGSIGTAVLSTFASTAAAHYLIGKNPANPAVQAQAAIHSYQAVYLWSAAFFAVGVLITVLLYRPAAPQPEPAAAAAVHM